MTELFPFRTRNLTLRKFNLKDAPKIYLMSREQGIVHWIPDQVYKDEKNAADVLKYLMEKFESPGNPALSAFVLAVCLKETLELIGHVGLSPYCGEVEVGYAIEEKHRGKGYATEAVAALTDLGIGEMGLSKVLGIVHQKNCASCRVLEKTGFKLAEEHEGELHGRKGTIRRYEKGG